MRRRTWVRAGAIVAAGLLGVLGVAVSAGLVGELNSCTRPGRHRLDFLFDRFRSAFRLWRPGSDEAHGLH